MGYSPHPCLKMKLPQQKNEPPHTLKNEAPLQEMIPRKTKKILKTAINICILLIKQ